MQTSTTSMFFSLQGNSLRLAMRDGVFFGWGGVEP